MRELLKNSGSFLIRRQTNILSAATVIMATYGVSHVMGLIKTRLLITYFFGSQASLLDVYYAAFVIPDTIFQLLVIGSLSAAFIPVFTRYLSRRENEAWHIASSALNVVLLIFFAVSLGIFIFAAPLCRLIAPGFSPDQISVMSSLLRVMLSAQIFFVISGFLTGMIQSHQRFIVPALAPLVYNLGIITGIVFLSPSLGIYGPAIGVVLGAFLHMTIQIPIALRLGFRPSLNIDFRHPGVIEVVKLMPPRALALGIDQIEQFIAVILASLLASGSLSLFNVARLLYAIPSSLFGATIGQAALPVLSRQFSETEGEKYQHTFSDALLQIVYLAMPLSVLFIVLRIPIVRLVFGASSFPWTATLLTGKTLAILAASATFSAMMQLVTRGFYALHDTRTPLIVGLFAAGFDIVFGVVAVQVFHWGILGLAAAISFTMVCETTILLFLLSRQARFPISEKIRVVKSLAKMVITGLVTGVSLWAPMRLLDRFVFDTTRTIPLLALTGITSIIGLATYIFFSYIFRVDELTIFLALGRRLARWRDIIFPKAKEPLILPAPDQN